jgi:hypothetical protein
MPWLPPPAFLTHRGFNAVMESLFSTIKSELADRFDSVGQAKMELLDYIEASITGRVAIRPSARSVRPSSNDVRALHRARWAPGGSHSPGTGEDGHATERPSAFYDHCRERH